jgi:hypothetical protein
MKKIYLVLLISILQQFSFAQSVEWVKNYGGTARERVYHANPTADGGMILCGFSLSNDNDFAATFGDWDAYIMKLDANGTKQWVKMFGGSVTDVALPVFQTKDGGYMMGVWSDSKDGDFTGQNGDSDIIAMKLDANGNLLWKKYFGGSDYDSINTIIETADGGFVLAGEIRSKDGDFTSNNGLVDLAIIKIDANGTKQWVKTFGGSLEDIPYSIALGADNAIYVAGTSESKDFDFTQNIGLEDFILIKLSNDGKTHWLKHFGGTGDDDAWRIRTTKDNNFIIVGTSTSTDGHFTKNYGERDAQVMKIDTSGKVLWTKNYGGTSNDLISDVKETADGGLLLLGSSDSEDFDLPKYYGLADYFAIHTDSKGNKRWTKNYGGSEADFGRYIVAGANNSFYLVGYGQSNTNDFPKRYGDFDIQIIKIKNDFVSASAVNWDFELKTYPNPLKTNDLLNVSFHSESTSPIEIHIFNLMGQKCFTQKIQANEGKNSIEIPFSLAKGIYTLQLQSVDNQVSKLIVVE